MKKIAVYSIVPLLLASCGNRDDFDATGTFEATEVVVSAEATGRILYFEVEEGDTLVAGRQVGAIDTVQLYLQKLQLEPTKQLDDINASIRVLNGQLEALLSNLENNTSALDANASAVDLQIAQVEDRLAKCRIASPIDGSVLVKYSEAGELAAAGRPLMKVADMSRLYLRAYFTSDQLARLKVGQEVTVVADFGGDQQREYPGRITWIASESEFTPKTIQTRDTRANLVYAVKIAVENDGLLKIGLYGEVRLPEK